MTDDPDPEPDPAPVVRPTRAQRRARRRALARRVLAVLGLLLAYFCIPIGSDITPVRVAVQALGVLVGIVVLGWMMGLETIHAAEGSPTRTVAALAFLLALVVFVFSLAFYLTEQVDSSQFVDLHTRVDALYFTLASMTTIGYGDVHAEGQFARVLVIGLIIFNVVIVASLVRSIPQLRRMSRRD